MKYNFRLNLYVAVFEATFIVLIACRTSRAQPPSPAALHSAESNVILKIVSLDGIEIVHRKAGPMDGPVRRNAGRHSLMLSGLACNH
ncbi:hypothetical protein [Neorhodopirellula pilleata]|uniref:Uncharacterized protein n=1 Tax=Neorhodopirellula pilleata TaxID=2714738 RepID=A0A5C6ADH0_9BACT|nr:hypothetical protein [Neorhodopirellula pilleata]TWT97111.1 hypothetical protein Pla100_22600 [Neorhodopirellula pilleata]